MHGLVGFFGYGMEVFFWGGFLFLFFFSLVGDIA